MKENKRSLMERIGSFALAVVLILGLLPVQALADDSQRAVSVGDIVTVADPDTVSRPVNVYGNNTENAGKITVGKSVSDGAVTLQYGNSSQTFTPGEDSFIVTVSQTAQVMGMVTENTVPLDVVFILDTSGSMNENGVNRSSSMVTAANAAIKTLLEANEHNRVAVVAFSSNTYGGGTSEDAAANVLSSLAHYTGEAATNHLTWVTSGGSTSGMGSKNYIAGRDMVTVQTEDRFGNVTTSTSIARRHGYNGGTNMHAGIVAGAKLLTASSNNPVVTTENGTQTRMPFIVILSDGQPTFSVDNATWYDPTGTTEQGNGSSAYAGNGFLPAVTAAYYKGKITEKYYGSNASESNRCAIYTIGVQLDEELAEITLNPKENFISTAGNGYYNTFNSYWNSFNATNAANFNVKVNRDDNYSVSATSIRAARDYVNGKSSTGKTMYNGGLAYNDDYFSATQTADIENAFKNVVNSIQIKAMSVPTEVDTAYGEDFSGYVTFTDPIGEYMEVKNVHGLLANGEWYRGQSMAYNLQNWSSAPQSFKEQFARTIQTRGMITGTGIDINSMVSKMVASPNQAYWNSNSDYDNSVVWWGNDIDSANEVDEHVQFLDIANNDTLEYIQSAEAQAIIERLGAEYVCRSYFFYGTSGDYSQIPEQELMYFIIRVQRSLKAPYQQTVVVSAPASLLSVEKVLVTEKTDANGNMEYTVSVAEAEPARVVYEVGLRSDINAFNVAQILEQDQAYLNETAKFGDSTVHTNYDVRNNAYTFYTNDWDRSKSEGGHERAMTKATFDAASDNDFYTYTKDTVIYIKSGNSYVPYTGTEKPVGNGYYYARTVYDWSGASKNADGTYDAKRSVEYIPVTLPDSDVIFANGGNWYIRKGAYKASSLTGGEDVYKSENKTQTSAVVVHPHRTSSETDSHYTVYLGNNGKLTLKAVQSKHVSITKPDGVTITDGDGKVVMVGDVLTYTLSVVNYSDGAVTADVTDAIPAGTAYIDGSATHGGVVTGGQLTWNDIPVAAGETVQVSFQVVVTDAALSGELDVSTIDNEAYVQLSNGFSYTTNVTQNPPEGKKVVDTEGATIAGGVEVHQVLVFRVRWHNDSGSTATVKVTDVIPTGTTYVQNSASHNAVYDEASKTLTWTIQDVAADASGVVSFRVNVNASAVQYIENSAFITIGSNDPRQTNETQVAVKTGDLVLTKAVQDNGFSGAADQSFTLNITEVGLNLSGEYTLLRNGTAEKVTFTKGVAKVIIAHGETLEIQGIPAGAIISVTEVNKQGFTPSYQTAVAVSGAEGRVTIAANADVRVDVTNVYTPDAVSLEMEGTKALVTSADVGDLTFGFTAYACDANGQNLVNSSLLTGEATVSSANKTVEFKFAPITFATEGTFYYLISELNGHVTGVTYSAEQYLVAVTVTDDGSGKLNANAELSKWDAATSAFVDATALSFTNTYAPKQTELTLAAQKVLNGRTLKNGEFSFVVMDGNNNLVSTGTNDENGNVTFRPITYKTAGTYTYTIREVAGSLHGVEYSTAVYSVTVTVVDDNGQLKAQVSYPSGGVVFTNKFTPDGIRVSLLATKSLDNRSGDSSRVLKDNEFRFVAKNDAGEVVATGSNLADGSITFSPIGYTAADIGKTYTYYISEIKPDLSADPYMHYDETVFQVSVTITQDGFGNLVSEVMYPTGGVVFTNIQYPNFVEITPAGNKTTQDATSNLPSTATFSFTVANVDTGNEAAVGVGSANGPISFSTLSFSEPGTYRYWVKETHSGTVHGITYDATKYLLVVDVTLTDGQLNASYKYYSLAAGGNADDAADYTVELNGTVPAFQNTYNAKGQIAVQAIKRMTGMTLKAGDFAFRLVRKDTGAGVSGLVVDDAGIVQFATIYYDTEDLGGQSERILEYIMTEVIPQSAKHPGVKYDETQHSIFIKIVDNGDGTIGAKLVNSQGEPILDANQQETTDTGVVFNNSYAPVQGVDATIEAVKILTGRDLASGEFSFNLYHINAAGVENLVDTATNDAAGNICFNRVYAPTIMAGNDKIEITYVIREANNHLGGVEYDTTAFTVKVTLTDNKDGTISSSVAYESVADGELPTFRNEYEAEGTSFAPEASKVLQNRDIRKDEFSFVIVDNSGNVVSTGTNNADKDEDGLFDDIVFTPIGYDAEGEYSYTVYEVQGNLPGMQYTNVVYKLVVKVVDDGAGKLVPSGTYYAENDAQNATAVDAVFTNVFTPEDVTVQLQANKVLNGRDMKAGEFSFVVEDLQGNLVATGGNAAAQNGQSAQIVFSHIGYTMDDLGGAEFVDMIYKIRELDTTMGGVRVDSKVYYVQVRLSYNTQTGTLSADILGYSDNYQTGAFTSNLSAVTFTNTYAPSAAQLVIPTDKTLINKVLENNEFTFVLKDASGAVKQEKGNAADGSVNFDALVFEKPGTYIYTVSEKVTDAAKADRYTLDNSFAVIVTVVDDLKGNLIATATYHEMDASGNYDAAENLGGVEFINHYTAPPVTKDLSLAIRATKTVIAPEGTTYSPAGFLFDVVDIKNNVISVGTSDASGNITFEPFTFHQAGEYHYWIYEKDSAKGGITEDPRAWEIHILVRYSEQTGLLYIADTDVRTFLFGRSVEQNSAPAFENVYQPAPAKLYLTAKKHLEGRELREREFLFYLMEGELIAAEAYNDANGQIKFELVYTKTGIHNYKIVESQGNLGGVSYDTTAYSVLTVEVKDDGNGQLVAYIGGEAMSNGATASTGKTITNTYEAKPAQAVVVAHKHLLGNKILQGDDFVFELKNKDVPEEVYTVKNDRSGHVEFTLTMEKKGTFTYTLREIKGNDPSITYDETVYTVVITVTDDGLGQLHAQVAVENAEENHGPVFRNTYRALPVTAEIKAHKTLLGEKPLAQGLYTFELEGEGIKISDVTNDAVGNVVFHVTLDEVGEYSYVLREVQGTDAGTTYDATEYKVKVIVTDNLEGNLVAEVVYEDLEEGKLPSFTNSYQGAEVPVKITATKIMDGRKLTAEEFSFQLVNKLDPTQVLTAKNDADGNVVFDLLFENSGVYVYTLSEVAGTDTNITYDANSYTVTVTVTDDLKGYLTAKVEYSTENGAAPIFKNAYTPNAVALTLEGIKKLTGKELEDGEFSFQVRDGQGNLVATGKNNAEGSIVFTQIKLPTEGKYTFRVNEVKGNNVNVTYDETVFTVTVQVTNDNGVLKVETVYPEGGIVFENIYEKVDPNNPDTGDHSGLVLYAVILAASLVGFAVVLVAMTKRSRKSYWV